MGLFYIILNLLTWVGLWLTRFKWGFGWTGSGLGGVVGLSWAFVVKRKNGPE